MTMNPSSNDEAHPTQRPRSSRRAATLAVAIFLLTASGCGDNSSDPVFPFENFDPANFGADSADVTNTFLPLTPGTRYIYDGFTVENGVDVAHRVEINVMNITKVIAGVRTRVSYDLDFSAGRLVESENAYFAQDKSGNVWRIGEYPVEQVDGDVLAVPTWLAGYQDAVAGISMMASPQPNTPSYSQGWGPAVGFTDRGQVDEVELSVRLARDFCECKAAGTCDPITYNGVLKIAESATGEAGQQTKFFAPNLGNILVGFRGQGEATRERLELCEVEIATGGTLEDLCDDSMRLEEDAVASHPTIFGTAAPRNKFGPTERAEVDGGGPCRPVPFEDFDPANFDATSADITNPFLPLAPGTRMIFQGVTAEDDEDVDHRVEIIGTNLTKMIAGVRSRVSYDLDFSAGELVEAETAYFAQDMDGNVWRMGEYPEEYENGELVVAPTWLQGQQGAVAGISMKADPQLGTPSYSQGWGPAVDFTDRGKVDALDLTVPLERDFCDCLDTGTCDPITYDGVLRVAEFAAGEPGQQLKFFAPGIGNVLVGFRGSGEQTRERLELCEIEILEGDALADVCEAALALEANAYETAPEVFGPTEPSVPDSGSCR